MRFLYYLLSFGTLGLFLVALVQDASREWKVYQQGYYDREIERLEGELKDAPSDAKPDLERQLETFRRRPLQIKQLMGKDLGVIDRCVTCHVGLDAFTNPALVNGYLEHPYKAPDVEAHKVHNLQQFGCTTCHQGQGLALTSEDAHGFVKHWEEPLLRQPYLQGACLRCHEDYQKHEAMASAAKGARLFADSGCIGCHSMNGRGGVISVDLGDIADKPLSRIDFSNTPFKGPVERTRKNWILAHFIFDPMEIVPGDPHGHLGEPIPPSGMPPFKEVLSRDDAESLAAFLLSKTAHEVPHDYYVYDKKEEPEFDDEVEHGAFVFKKYGCNGCHGEGGAKPWRNFNALGPDQEDMADGLEPNLPKLMGTYTREELREKIREGVPASQISKFKADGPTPPLYMPAWKDKIEGEELEHLISYLLSIAEEEEAW